MLYNDIDHRSGVRAGLNGVALNEDDIRGMELLRARRSLAYLKDVIGNDTMRTLLADDLDAATRQTAEWVERSAGAWRSGALTMRVPGPDAVSFHHWFMGNMKLRNEPVFRAGHPDHFLNHPLPDGGAEVIENVGEDERPWHIFLRFHGADTEFPTQWDPSYPLQQSFGVVISDANGLRIGSAMHELRDGADGGLEVKLTVHLPQAAPAELVDGHLRHFAVEFRNWTEMARHGVAVVA